MKFQIRTYTCGAAAIRNALRVLGIFVSEKAIWKVASISKAGTDKEDHSIVDGLRAFGATAVMYQSDKRQEAWEWLRGCLLSGKPVILCVDNWSHWVVCCGLIGDKVIIVDSARTVRNKRENGTHVLPYTKLLRRWKKRNGTLDAIAASRV